MSKMKRHMARVHPGKKVKVSYHPVPDIGKKIKEMKVKCFGAFAGSAAEIERYLNSTANSGDRALAGPSSASVPLKATTGNISTSYLLRGTTPVTFLPVTLCYSSCFIYPGL